MSMRVLLSPLADDDLTAIFDSLFSLNPTAARNLGKRIIFRFHMLGQNPELGERCAEPHSNLRRTTVEKFAIYYRLLPTHVQVVRIVHGYRDHGPLLADLD